MTPVELLREAAQTMRDNAESASAGPWSAGDVDDEGCVSLMYGDYGWYITGPAGSPEFADTEQGKADAIHVASWHPAVALAVADWLDWTAPHLAHSLAAWSSPTAITKGDPEMVRRLVEDHYGRALAVARAYLGGES